MRISMKDLAEAVKGAVLEAKKKPDEDEADRPDGFIDAPVHDYSEPQGDRNRLRRQGSNPGWGPTTEQKIRTVVRAMVREAMGAPDSSMTAPTRQKIQRLGAKFPWFGDWVANVTNHPGDPVAKIGYAEQQLSAKGAKGLDFIDGLIVAAEMVRGEG